MPQIDGTLGIIAGSGDLPRELVRHCLAANQAHHVIAFENITEIGTYKDTDHSLINLGQIGSAIDILKEHEIQQVILAGAVGRPDFSTLSFDFTGLRLLKRLATLSSSGDDQVFSTIINFIEERGFTVIGADALLSDLLIPSGALGKHTPDKQALRDIAIAQEATKVIGSLDIGQAVICQQGNILGVEGAEGTDRLIARCADLHNAGAGGVLVKTCKPDQDMRVDLPSIGTYTVENIHRAGLRGVALEASKSLVIDRDAVIEKADALGLFIVGI